MSSEENHDDVAEPDVVLDAGLGGEADEGEKRGSASYREEEESAGYVSD